MAVYLVLVTAYSHPDKAASLATAIQDIHHGWTVDYLDLEQRMESLGRLFARLVSKDDDNKVLGPEDLARKICGVLRAAYDSPLEIELRILEEDSQKEFHFNLTSRDEFYEASRLTSKPTLEETREKAYEILDSLTTESMRAESLIYILNLAIRIFETESLRDYSECFSCGKGDNTYFLYDNSGYCNACRPTVERDD